MTQKKTIEEIKDINIKDAELFRQIQNLLQSLSPTKKLKLNGDSLIMSGGESQFRSYSKGGVRALMFIFERMKDCSADELQIANKIYNDIKALPQMKSEMEHRKVKALIEKLDKRFASISDAAQDKRHSTTSVSDNETGV